MLCLVEWNWSECWLFQSVSRLAMETRKIVKGNHSRKTASFVRVRKWRHFITLCSFIWIHLLSYYKPIHTSRLRGLSPTNSELLSNIVKKKYSFKLYLLKDGTNCKVPEIGVLIFQACAAYCFITIPSLNGIFSRLSLYLSCGQMALLNNCLTQGKRLFTRRVCGRLRFRCPPQFFLWYISFAQFMFGKAVLTVVEFSTLVPSTGFKIRGLLEKSQWVYF